MTLNEFDQTPLGAQFKYKYTGDKLLKESKSTVRLVNGNPEFTNLYSVIYDNVDNLPVIDLSLLE